MPNVIRNLNHSSALRAFVEGLNEPVRLIIKASRFNQLQDAIQAAVEEEKSHQVKKQNLSNNKDFPKCKICGKNNHHTNQCYFREQTSSSLNNGRSNNQQQPHSSNNSNNQSGTVVCRYCKKIGHSIDVCRKRIYNNSRQISNSNTAVTGSNQNNFATQQNPGNEPGPSPSSSGARIRDVRSTAH